MKEQQETNNASPAAAVNLQMWPSAPREGGREWEAGRSSDAFSLPKHKACPNSGLPGLLWTQPEEGRWPCSSPLSSLLLTSELPTQQGLPSQAGSFTDHFCPFFFFSISGFSFLTLHRHLACTVCEDFCFYFCFLIARERRRAK